MEGELQDQDQIDQDLEDWLSPISIQYVRGFFYDEEKQEYIRIEDSATERATMSNQAPEGVTSTMVVVKCPDKV